MNSDLLLTLHTSLAASKAAVNALRATGLTSHQSLLLTAILDAEYDVARSRYLLSRSLRKHGRHRQSIDRTAWN